MSRNDQVGTVVTSFEMNMGLLHTEAHRVANESTAAKSEAEPRYTEMQSQVITASQQKKTSGVSMAGRTSEPFAPHKLIIGKERIPGDGDLIVIDDWNQRTANRH